MLPPEGEEKFVVNYRVYILEEGRIRSADQFSAETDEAARAYVEGRRKGRVAELWHHDRVVFRYDRDTAHAPTAS